MDWVAAGAPDVTSGVIAAATQVGCPAADWNPEGCTLTADAALMRLASRSLDASLFGCVSGVADELKDAICDPVRAECGAWLNVSSALLRSTD